MLTLSGRPPSALEECQRAASHPEDACPQWTSDRERRGTDLGLAFSQPVFVLHSLAGFLIGDPHDDLSCFQLFESA